MPHRIAEENMEWINLQCAHVPATVDTAYVFGRKHTLKAKARRDDRPPGEKYRLREIGSGGGIRTPDLWVMSPTSYQTAPPRNRDGRS